MSPTKTKTMIPSIRGLPATRRGAIVLALACAVTAALVLVVALGQYRKHLTVATRQDTVLVAISTIQKGTSGDAIAAQQLYRATPVTAQSLAAGAITDASRLQGQVTTQDILPGQQLTIGDFAPVQSGVVGQLSANQRAVSIALDPAHGLSGLVEPGDRVDVYGDFNVQNVNGTSANGVSSGSGGGAPVVRLLIPDALVVKTSDSGGGGGLGGGGGSGSGTVSLAINATQVGALTFAAENGKVWLALRPGNATTPSQGLTTLSSEVFGTQSGSKPSGSGG
jgi:pilus assembly protein CpaB